LFHLSCYVKKELTVNKPGRGGLGSSGEEGNYYTYDCHEKYKILKLHPLFFEPTEYGLGDLDPPHRLGCCGQCEK